MTVAGVLQILLYVAMVALIAWPLGAYMARVFAGERTPLHPALRPLERLFYRLLGVDESHDMRWTTYAASVMWFSAAGLLLTYALLRLQGVLPLNPHGLGPDQMPPDLAFNTAASFATNTNWQSYAPEATVSTFSNMFSLAIHNWMSAACGIAVAIAVVRGFSRGSASGLGNFWVDATRATLYVLLPLCTVGALLLVWQGVPQTLAPSATATTLEGASQPLRLGPVASQVAVKLLGTNGGGFFSANSAHPYENPTPLSNWLQMLAIFAIPGALTHTFGRMVGNARQGWALFAAMAALFVGGALVLYGAEQAGNPQVAQHHVMREATSGQPGGSMEGKETRFGIASSALFVSVTTAASCGAVNAMHESLMPLGGMVALANIVSGQVIFGGVGSGLYGMLLFAVLAVFIAGLMVGRTPEYLGKKIGQYEVKMAMLAVLVLAVCTLGFSALAANMHFPSTPGEPAAAWNRWPGGAYGSADRLLGATCNNVNNAGPRGLTSILYAYASASGNNGSAFAGLTTNTPFYNLTLGLAMLAGRFLVLAPILAMAGSLAAKGHVPVSAGTFPTDTGTFVALLVGVVLVVGALTYLPALALGPVVEHLQMHAGRLH